MSSRLAVTVSSFYPLSWPPTGNFLSAPSPIPLLSILIHSLHNLFIILIFSLSCLLSPPFIPLPHFSHGNGSEPKLTAHKRFTTRSSSLTICANDSGLSAPWLGSYFASGCRDARACSVCNERSTFNSRVPSSSFFTLPYLFYFSPSTFPIFPRSSIFSTLTFLLLTTPY